MGEVDYCDLLRVISWLIFWRRFLLGIKQCELKEEGADKVKYKEREIYRVEQRILR